MEKQGIDPCTLRMLSEYSTIWATSPCSRLFNLWIIQNWGLLKKKYCIVIESCGSNVLLVRENNTIKQASIAQ